MTDAPFRRWRAGSTLAALVTLATALVVLARAHSAFGEAPAPSVPRAPELTPSAAEALLAVADADPLELARVVERFGDAELRALLARPRDVAACLAAVWAAPQLRRPELALEALVSLAEGRDSLLAPAAARAALTIAVRLDADTLAARELPATELGAVRAALLSLAARATAGADVRLAAATAAEALAAASVP